MIENGANVNGADISGFTPLHVAIVKDNTTIIHLLLKFGARITLMDNIGNNAVECSLFKKKIDTFKITLFQSKNCKK